MASDKNEVTVEGNLTRDPVLKTTRSGVTVCNFSIASNRFYKKGDEFEKEVSFFDVQCWNNAAEYVYGNCQKGSLVEVKGRIKQDRWTDKEGNSRNRVIIVANDVIKQQRQGNTRPPQSDGSEYRHEDYGDRCPF